MCMLKSNKKFSMGIGGLPGTTCFLIILLNDWSHNFDGSTASSRSEDDKDDGDSIGDFEPETAHVGRRGGGPGHRDDGRCSRIGVGIVGGKLVMEEPEWDGSNNDRLSIDAYRCCVVNELPLYLIVIVKDQSLLLL